MSKYKWHVKHNGACRYWVILNDERYRDVGILQTSYLINEKEVLLYILYKGHLTLGHFDTLRSAKQSFALRVKKGGM